MMRIGYVGNTPPPIGGAEIHLEKIAEAMEKKGHETTIFRKNPIQAYNSPLKSIYVNQLADLKGGRAYRIRGVMPVKNLGIRKTLTCAYDRLFRFRRLAGMLSSLDAVHINGVPTAHHVEPALRGCKKSIYITAHGPAELFEKEKLPEITKGFAVSEYTKRLFEEKYRPGFEIETIYNPVDTTLFGPADGREGSLIYVGRLFKVKNIELLLNAAAGSKNTRELHIVGEGPEREHLERVAKDLGISKKVTFHGEVKNANLPGYFRLADAFALSSRLESLPVSMLEAMSCCKKAVVPRIGGIPEFIKDRKTGYLFEEGDLEGLTGQIDLCLEEKRKGIGKKARKLVEKKCETKKIADRLEKAYERDIQPS